MEQILTPDQIAALLRKAQSSAAAIRPRSQAGKVERFDLRQAGQLSAAQQRSVSTLHEEFAKRASKSLSSFLRVNLEMTLASVRQVPYGEFLRGLPDLTYLASIRVPSPEARVLVQADPPLVFSVVDLILGGSGKEQIEPRELTDIEGEIFESAVRVLCHELRAAWTPVLDLAFQYERRQQKAAAQAFSLPSEKILVLNFETHFLEETAKLCLVLPAVISNALLRKVSEEASRAEPAASQKNQLRLRELVLQGLFSVELELPPSTVSMRDILKLEPGGILALQPRSNDPIRLNVAGKNMFLALPVRCGAQRGAQVHKILSIAEAEGKEAK